MNIVNKQTEFANWCYGGSGECKSTGNNCLKYRDPVYHRGRITNTDIDEIYNIGISSGAVGGKLLGAGGGGFILFLTPPELQQQVADKLKLKQVPVNFEYLGSQMIYHDYQDQEE